jgi:phosphoketolase
MTTAANTETTTLTERDIALLDRYWRAANYLSVGQIYLLDNPLLREPLLEHVIDRVKRLGSGASGLRQQMVDERLRHRAYTGEVGDDPRDVRDWTWPGSSGA